MIVAMVLLFVALVLAVAVTIRHFQLKVQLDQLDQQIEQLEAQLGPDGTDYFISCSITFLVSKRNNIRRKMFF